MFMMLTHQLNSGHESWSMRDSRCRKSAGRINGQGLHSYDSYDRSSHSTSGLLGQIVSAALSGYRSARGIIIALTLAQWTPPSGERYRRKGQSSSQLFSNWESQSTVTLKSVTLNGKVGNTETVDLNIWISMMPCWRTSMFKSASSLSGTR